MRPGCRPRGARLLVVEDNALAERLATDPSVAFLSFIGSAKVGWYLRSKLSPGTRCALEHGGAAPVIVDRSVEIDAIVEPVVKGGYYHAGQVCVSVQRIFVHADIMPQLRRSADRTGARTSGRRSYLAGYRDRSPDPSQGGRPRGRLGHGGA